MFLSKKLKRIKDFFKLLKFYFAKKSREYLWCSEWDKSLWFGLMTQHFIIGEKVCSIGLRIRPTSLRYQCHDLTFLLEEHDQKKEQQREIIFLINLLYFILYWIGNKVKIKKVQEEKIQLGKWKILSNSVFSYQCASKSYYNRKCYQNKEYFMYFKSTFFIWFDPKHFVTSLVCSEFKQ